jgi:hypothetical protein
MDKRLDRLEIKIDKIIEQQVSHNITLQVNTKSLQDHMKRSDALEAIVLPMKKKWDMAEGAMKLIGMAATAIGLIAGIVKIIDFFTK